MIRLVKWLLLVLLLAGGALALWLWQSDDGSNRVTSSDAGPAPASGNAVPLEHHDRQDQQALEQLIRSRLKEADGGG